MAIVHLGIEGDRPGRKVDPAHYNEGKGVYNAHLWLHNNLSRLGGGTQHSIYMYHIHNWGDPLML